MVNNSGLIFEVAFWHIFLTGVICTVIAAGMSLCGLWLISRGLSNTLKVHTTTISTLKTETQKDIHEVDQKLNYVVATMNDTRREAAVAAAAARCNFSGPGPGSGRYSLEGG